MPLSWLKSLLAAASPVADVAEHGTDPLPPIPK